LVKPPYHITGVCSIGHIAYLYGMDDYNLASFMFIGLIIFFAFFIRSLTGFGSSLISIPLLALWLDLKFTIPFVTLFEVGISLLLIKSVWRKISWSMVGPMIVGAIVGVALGSALLNLLADAALKKILGGVIILVALNLLRGVDQTTSPLSAYWGGLAGGLGGFLGGMFGASGPPYVAYLSFQLKDKAVLRASLIGLFTVEQTWRAGVFTMGGLITKDMLELAFWLTPVLIAGTILGHKVHFGVNEIRFRQIVALLLLISGGLLLI